jgi:hypothetical protein
MEAKPMALDGAPESLGGPSKRDDILREPSPTPPLKGFKKNCPVNRLPPGSVSHR